MNIDKIKHEIDELRKKIREHDYKYYVLNQPEISDYEYDILYKRLKELEEKYPQLITKDSPTQRVSGEVLKEFASVKHTSPMLSLDNTYSKQEILNWLDKIDKYIPKNKIEFIVEPKIDGLSCAVYYQNLEFSKAATRGDGEYGEDVTLNVKTIKSIPLKLNELPKQQHLEFLEIRGEVFINKKDFEDLNKFLSKNNEQLFSNPRNAASGSLRQKNPIITSQRPLRFFVHSYGKVVGNIKLDKDSEFLSFCKKLGLPVIEHFKVFNNINDVIENCNYWEKNRDKLSYDIDGMVIKVNQLNYREEIGYTSKSPRWAIAYKFPSKQATTVVKNISVNVGRTGILTPVAELQPVECGGVKISNASLHNFDEVKRLGIKIGDTVVVERAGEVIPKIVKVIESKRTGKEIPIEIPKKCPICGSKIVKEKEDQVAYICPNPLCPKQIINTIVHFASRDAMNIEGLGEKVAQQLVDNKLVKNISDIYALTENDLAKLHLFKEKKINNLLSAINASKKKPLSKFLYSLGIRHVGEKTAKILANKFKNIDNIMNCTEKELAEISDIGPIIANSIYNFFKREQTKEIINKFKKYNLNLKEDDIVNIKEQIFKDYNIVFTGELEKLTRAQAEKIVFQLGGNPRSNVSKNTSFVVVGNNPGSKYEKAKALNIKILTEKEFLDLVSKYL